MSSNMSMSAAAAAASSSSSTSFSPDQPLSPSDQLCYVHCCFCDTVLAVSVPCTSLFKTVTVRCGHCTNLLSVNMHGLLLPAANHQLHLGHSFFTPQNLLEEIRNAPSSNMLMNQLPNHNDSAMQFRGGHEEIPKPPPANRRWLIRDSSVTTKRKTRKSKGILLRPLALHLTLLLSLQ